MKTILIAGGTGLVGGHICKILDPKYYKIKILTRTKKAPEGHISYHEWDINKGTIDEDALDADYLINLTGAGIADSRWTESRKKLLVDSRVDSTMLIHNEMKRLGKKFKATVSASAIGYYGDRADEILDESASPGDEFMATCCMLWEDASHKLSAVSDKNNILRVGVVLSTQGGALPKILMTKAIRVFNYFGDGKQYYSWIHIDDISRAFLHLLEHGSGDTYNGVVPKPLTNKQFTEEIKEAVGSGLVMSAPAFGLRIALGEMANVVLNSSRVVPSQLIKSGFEYNFPKLTDAVKNLLKSQA